MTINKKKKEKTDKPSETTASSKKQQAVQMTDNKEMAQTRKQSPSSKTDKEKVSVNRSVFSDKISDVTKTIQATTKKWAAFIGKKTPEVAETVAGKTKTLASTVSEKTGEAVTFGRLKIRLYSLKNNVEKKKSELGGKTYELLRENNTGIYDNEQIMSLIKELKSLDKDIKTTQKMIEEIGTAEKK